VVSRLSVKPKVGDFARGGKKCNELLHVPSLVDGKVTVLLMRYFPY
jgi:hypothetical protein